APFDAVVSMNGDPFADDESLDAGGVADLDSRELDLLKGAADALVRQGHGVEPRPARARRADEGGRPSIIDWRRRGRLAVLDRLARFTDRQQAPVLVPHDAAHFAIDHRVTMTGADDPTASSCPSREQITPG